MRIYKIIGDWLLETNIVEQAARRAEVESKINSLSFQVIRHLIKVLKWEDQINHHKHLIDIDEWISQIDNLKIKGNKRPTKNDYYRWMFGENDTPNYITKQIKTLSKQYGSLRVIRSDELVYQTIRNIMECLAVVLSLDEFVSIEDLLPISNKIIDV